MKIASLKSVGDVAAVIISMTSYERNVIHAVCLSIRVLVQIHRIIKQKQHPKEFQKLVSKIHTDSQNSSPLRCEHSARELLSHWYTHGVGTNTS